MSEISQQESEIYLAITLGTIQFDVSAKSADVAKETFFFFF